MRSKLHVGNLPFTFTEVELEELFGKFGKVESVNLIKDRDSGRSKGFAFIQMATRESAQEAILELDGEELGGREIAVSEAKVKNSPGVGSFRAARGAGYHRNRS